MGFMFLFMVLGVILIQRAACDSMSRCDLAKHTSCMAQLDENHRMLFRMDITELGLINSCNKLNDALACTNEVIVDGCPEEVKHFLPPVPAYFGLARDTLCGKGVGVGIIKLHRCRDVRIMEKCRTAASHHKKQGSGGETTSPEDECRTFKTELVCMLKATKGCPAAAQPGKDAMKKYLSGRLALEGCPSLGDSENAGSISAPWNSVILGALCSTLLFPILYQKSVLQA